MGQMQNQQAPALADFNSLTDRVSVLEALTVNGLSDASSLCSLYNCTGTLSGTIKYKISGNFFIIAGRIRITSCSRTGSNPGITVSLPNGKKVDGSFQAYIALSGGSGIRSEEAIEVVGTDDATSIQIKASESVANFSGTKWWTAIPVTVIKIK